MRLDVEARPQKSPRAFCAAIVIPGEVMLVINPHGGQDDYAALFHEAGHTEHFAHVRPLAAVRRARPRRQLRHGGLRLRHGAPHVRRRLAASSYLDWPDAGEFVAFKRFHKLYIVRRYAAKLLYELELHRSDNPRSKSKRYADLLTTHLGVRYNPADYLFDVDDGFYCARYLRAWAFEAQLRRHLETDFGEQWFLSVEAGARLKRLWSMGQRRPVEELARETGLRGSGLRAPLFDELRT